MFCAESVVKPKSVEGKQ